MRFGKTSMFFGLNGLIALCFVIYFLPWVFSSTVDAKIISPYAPATLHVTYVVNGKAYSGSYMRNGVSLLNETVRIRYLRFRHRTSVVNSFMGMWAEPLAWWGVFIFASAALLFTNNGVFSKGTVFQLQKKFPWLLMEEYFPIPNASFRHTSTHYNKHQQKQKQQLPGKDLA